MSRSCSAFGLAARRSLWTKPPRNRPNSMDPLPRDWSENRTCSKNDSRARGSLSSIGIPPNPARTAGDGVNVATPHPGSPSCRFARVSTRVRSDHDGLLGTGPSRVPTIVDVPRRHAGRHLHELDLRVLRRRDPSRRARGRGRRDRRLHAHRRDHLHVDHPRAHRHPRGVGLGRARHPHPDRRHRHRPPTAGRLAVHVPQRGLRPGRIPVPRTRNTAVPRRDGVLHARPSRRTSASGARSRSASRWRSRSASGCGSS